MDKVSQNDYRLFQRTYDRCLTHQRFGQAFCNAFYDTIGRADHTMKLFYTSDRGEAEQIIWKEFIEQ